MKNGTSVLTAHLIRADIAMWVGGLSLMLCLWYLLLHGQLDLLCAMLIGGILLLVSLRDKGSGAILTLGYLTIMGDLRRIVAASFGQPKFDLLLLVAPAVAVILALPMLLRLRFRDSLSKAVFGLLIVMILEIFNPQQGGLVVGASGALFYIAPILWFWIGRQCASPAVVGRLLYGCIFPLAVLAAFLGLFQTFVAFLPYQQAWIDLVSKTYTALHVGNSVRAFGFSVSGAEYATLLTFSATGTAAAYFGAKRPWAFAFPLLVLTVILASSRGLVVKMIFTLAIVWTLREGRKLNTVTLIRLGIFTVIGLVGVFGLASRFAGGSTSSAASNKSSAAQNALEHQATGLAHPLDSRSSTAGIHAQMLAGGILQGFVDPIGHGLGATTQAARKFAAGVSGGSSEIDFSDMFISLGLVGGLLYLYVIFQTVRNSIRFLQDVPRTIGLPTIAILASTLCSWLIGGQYSTSSLIFFLIGALVYKDNRAVVEQPQPLRSYSPALVAQPTAGN